MTYDDSEFRAVVADIKPKKAKSSETEAVIQKQILNYLRTQKIWHWRAATGGQLRWAKDGSGYLSPSASKGCPDILGVLPGGRMLMIEVKSAKGRVSPLQKDWIDRCNAQGGLAGVCRSVFEVRQLLLSGGFNVID